MEELLKQAPKVIREAAKSPLGIAALFILVIGAVGVTFFQGAADNWIKLAAYLMLIGGCLAFGLLAFRGASSKPTLVHPAPEKTRPPPSSDSLAEQAKERLAKASASNGIGELLGIGAGP